MKVKNISKVAGPMPVRDPFIISVYHRDVYPKGNGNMGPDPELLKGRNLGNDFVAKDGWNMYHGKTIPGFPHHPHKGFEIVTIVDEGYADHFDSLGSKGRYGGGDVQLMSAGSGVSHGEMFPMINDDKDNPFRLFQIWVNLAAKDKSSEPNYKMLWNEKIPHAIITDKNGKKVDVKVILGEYEGVKSLNPLPNSWANDRNHHVGIATVEMEAGTKLILPAVSETLNRFVFFYEGDGIVSIDQYKLQKQNLADLAGNQEIEIVNGDQFAKILILEGEPIGEPVAAHGPFVMNTQQEIMDAFADYQRTQFGGWPWGNEEADVVNPKDSGRFASYNFGERVDRP